MIKRYLITAGILFFPLRLIPVLPQSINENYVRVVVPRVAITDESVLSSAPDGRVLRSETLYETAWAGRCRECRSAPLPPKKM